MPEVRRFDSAELGHVTRRADGSLSGDAVVTRAGVFSYRSPDGTMRAELRPPEEVFHADSLESARMIPVTDGHPPEFVTSANARQYAIGWTGENVRQDGRHVLASLRILDAAGVKSVDGGRRQLSLGYLCEVERADGVFEGLPYSHIQRRIRYNHLALVDSARAGDAAVLRLDAADAIQTDAAPHTGAPPAREEPHMPGSRVRLDSGIEYEAPAEVAVALEQLRTQRGELSTRLDAATKGLAEATAARDKAQGERDAAKAELDKVQKTDRSDEIRRAARERIALEGVAAKTLPAEVVAKLDSMGDEAVRLAVIQSRSPEFKPEGRSADYMRARFDTIAETVRGEQHADNSRAIAGDGSQRSDACDAEKVREKAIKAAKDRSRGIEVK